MSNQNRFNLETKITGIIGHPIKQSFSPLMHNISFDLASLNFIYLPFDVPASNLKNAIRGMVALGIKGFNVTIPHKESIIPLLRNISEEASIIGAVNTIVNDNGNLNGYNTDAYGILETLLPFKDEINGAEVCLIGAGGAARSAIYILLRHFKPTKIHIVNRNEQRAESLKDYFSAKMHFNTIKTYGLFKTTLTEVFRNSKLVINSTSVGMYPNVDDAIITDYDSFSKGQVVFDMVYNPVKTKLLMLAEAAGAVPINGIDMFIHQGAKAFELWTNEQMPVEKITKALKLYLTSN